VGLRVGLDAVAKRKIPIPRRNSNPDRLDRPARSLVAIPTELSRLLDIQLEVVLIYFYKFPPRKGLNVSAEDETLCKTFQDAGNQIPSP
jgi:hypothetical protein